MNKQAKKQTSKKKVKAPVSVSSPSLPPVPTIPKGEFLVLDKEEVPIVGLFGAGPEFSYPKEFALVDSMAVGQSGTFDRSKLNVIDSIRKRLEKLSNKKFIVKKVSKEHSRIWRMKDGSVIANGGKKSKTIKPWSEKRRKLFEERHGKQNGTPILESQTN